MPGLGIAANLGSFRPRIQRHTLNAKADTALLELRRPVASTHGLQIRKQRADLWKRRKNFLDLLAETNLRRLLSAPARLHPNEADDPRLPIHILGLQVRQVRLRRAKMDRRSDTPTSKSTSLL